MPEVSTFKIISLEKLKNQKLPCRRQSKKEKLHILNLEIMALLDPLQSKFKFPMLKH